MYVGKAAVLKNRVRQYFQKSRARDVKTAALVAEIADTDWLETESEIDALFLESELIKRYKPRYNVSLRDDKSQLFVRIDMRSEWPTVTCTRNPSDDRAEYFGPFYNGYALKKALRYLRRVFPYFVKPPKQTDSRLEQQIGLNPRLEDGSDAYKASLRRLISYIKGNRVALVHEIEQAMKQAAAEQRFEDAARLRNTLRALHGLKRRIVFGDREFADISKDRALADLCELFALAAEPRRIESFDISHSGGRAVVGSMVVFTNGVSDRAAYRKFKVSETNDDYANMAEVITRRLSVKNLQHWKKPDLIIIDGGKGQLAAAIKSMQQREQRIPIISIAKRNELIVVHQTQSNVDTTAIEQRASALPNDITWQHEGEFVLINLHPGQQNASSHSKNLRAASRSYRYNDVTKLMQRIRDEAHRFALSYHHTLSRKKTTENALEQLPGIGPATKRKLLRKFGSVRGVSRASREELSQVVNSSQVETIASWSATL